MERQTPKENIFKLFAMNWVMSLESLQVLPTTEQYNVEGKVVIQSYPLTDGTIIPLCGLLESEMVFNS